MQEIAARQGGHIGGLASAGVDDINVAPRNILARGYIFLIYLNLRQSLGDAFKILSSVTDHAIGKNPGFVKQRWDRI